MEISMAPNPSRRWWAVRVYWEALSDQQLDTLQMTLVDRDAEKVVSGMGAVLKSEGEALNMAYISHIQDSTMRIPIISQAGVPFARKNVHRANLIMVQIQDIC
jgi:hypothetical protein